LTKKKSLADAKLFFLFMYYNYSAQTAIGSNPGPGSDPES